MNYGLKSGGWWVIMCQGKQIKATVTMSAPPSSYLLFFTFLNNNKPAGSEAFDHQSGKSQISPTVNVLQLPRRQKSEVRLFPGWLHRTVKDRMTWRFLCRCQRFLHWSLCACVHVSFASRRSLKRRQNKWGNTKPAAFFFPPHTEPLAASSAAGEDGLSSRELGKQSETIWQNRETLKCCVAMRNVGLD